MSTQEDFLIKLPCKCFDSCLIRSIGNKLQIKGEKLNIEDFLVDFNQVSSSVTELISKYGSDNIDSARLINRVKMFSKGESLLSVRSGIHRLLLVASKLVSGNLYRIVLLDYSLLVDSTKSNFALFSNWDNKRTYLVYKMLQHLETSNKMDLRFIFNE